MTETYRSPSPGLSFSDEVTGWWIRPAGWWESGWVTGGGEVAVAREGDRECLQTRASGPIQSSAHFFANKVLFEPRHVH